MLQRPKSSKIVPLWYENHILAILKPSKIVSKSMSKRLQNRLRLGHPLGSLKKSILDVKSLPRWPPKISGILQKSFEILARTASAPRCLLECFKSLPIASPKPPKSHPRAPPSLPRAAQEPSQAGFGRRYLLKPTNCLVKAFQEPPKCLLPLFSLCNDI